MDIIDEVAMVIARRRAKVVRGESVRRDRDVRTFGRSVAGDKSRRETPGL